MRVSVPTADEVRGIARILEVTSYPPPRSGWGVRVEYLREHLEAAGHEVVVLNIGQSRRIPSSEYETVLGALDYVRKVWRYTRRGFTAHVHANGSSWQGLVLALAAEVINLGGGGRPVLTFHAGASQLYFPRSKAWWLAPAFWLLFTVPRTVICNSAAVRDRICEYGVSRKKVVPIQAFSRQYLEFEEVALPEQVRLFLARFPRTVFCYSNIRPGFFIEVLVEGFAEVAASDGSVGLLLCGTAGYRDQAVWDRVQQMISARGLRERVCIVDDLDHDCFLTALKRSSICVRTPISDGVSSSVLEALALRVPVVAAENGTRPPGVITYRHDDPADLAAVLRRTLGALDEATATIPTVQVPDTVGLEADLLIGAAPPPAKDASRCEPVIRPEG